MLVDGIKVEEFFYFFCNLSRCVVWCGIVFDVFLVDVLVVDEMLEYGEWVEFVEFVEVFKCGEFFVCYVYVGFIILNIVFGDGF